MRDHESDDEPEGQNPQDGEDPMEDWERTPSPRRSRSQTIVLSDPSDEEAADEPTTRVVRFKDPSPDPAPPCEAQQAESPNHRDHEDAEDLDRYERDAVTLERPQQCLSQ